MKNDISNLYPSKTFLFCKGKNLIKERHLKCVYKNEFK